jgi:hypothetical protein
MQTGRYFERITLNLTGCGNAVQTDHGTAERCLSVAVGVSVRMIVSANESRIVLMVV